MSFSFDASRGPIVVEASLSGPTGQAVGYDLDTATDRVTAAMGNGVELVPRILLNRLSTLGRHRLAFLVLAHSLPPVAGIDGLLGLDFLRGSILNLDFPAGKITLG